MIKCLLRLIFAVCFLTYGKDLTCPDTIIALKGKSEIKKAGLHNWDFTALKYSMQNNDMIRTYKDAKTELKSTDRSIIISENARILFNYTSSKSHTLKSVTIYTGALFFTSDDTLPEVSENKVYTPSAVISMHGASFGVYVDPETGFTNVYVINGIVLVRNIKMNKDCYVKTGYKTEIGINTAPTLPKAVEAQDIEELKKTAGEDIINKVLNEQNKKQKRDAVLISGKAMDKIIITKLTDRSGYSGSWDICAGIAEMVADVLQSHTKAEIKISSDNSSDSYILGRKENARLVVKGEIETFEMTKKGQVNTETNKYMEIYSATVVLVFYVLDPVSGTVIKTFRTDEKISLPDSPVNDWKIVNKYDFDFKDKNFKECAIGQIITKLLDKIQNELIVYI